MIECEVRWIDPATGKPTPHGFQVKADYLGWVGVKQCTTEKSAYGQFGCPQYRHSLDCSHSWELSEWRQTPLGICERHRKMIESHHPLDNWLLVPVDWL